MILAKYSANLQVAPLQLALRHAIFSVSSPALRIFNRQWTNLYLHDFEFVRFSGCARLGRIKGSSNRRAFFITILRFYCYRKFLCTAPIFEQIFPLNGVFRITIYFQPYQNFHIAVVYARPSKAILQRDTRRYFFFMPPTPLSTPDVKV